MGCFAALSMTPVWQGDEELTFWLFQVGEGIQGWAAGIPTDSEDTLRFAEMTGVRPMIEKFPLEKAAEAYARMISGKAQCRVVLTI